LTTAVKQLETKIRRDVFRHVEAELYAYPYRRKEIDRLREEILYPWKPEDEQNVKNMGNKIGDPTAKKAIALTSHAKLVYLEQVVSAIEEVYNRLPEPKREFVRLKYWTHPQRLTTVGICQELGISDRTYSRWRSQIVSDIAEILGWK
jgi:RinA family phage transcriptional activator